MICQISAVGALAVAVCALKNSMSDEDDSPLMKHNWDGFLGSLTEEFRSTQFWDTTRARAFLLVILYIVRRK